MANDARRAHVDDVLTNISAQISCPFQIASQAVAFQAILRMVRVLMKRLFERAFCALGAWNQRYYPALLHCMPSPHRIW